MLRSGRTAKTASTDARLAWTRLALIAISILVAGCTGQGNAGHVNPSPAKALATPSPFAYHVWGEEPRRILAPTDFGLADAGSVIADSDVVQLPDGRLRVYILAGDAQTLRQYGQAPLRSAVSSDGLHWSPEAGLRCTRPTCTGSPAVVAIPAGGWRLFFDDSDGIASAVTQDGLNFTREPGLRIRFADLQTHPGWGFANGHIVKLREGGWRMYFGDEFRNAFVSTPLTQIYSAHSTNLVDWVIDPGVRARGVVRPFVIQQSDGSFRMFAAAVGQANLDACCIATATSADGMTWSSMTSTGLNGGDPVAFVTPDAQLRLFYNDTTAGAPATTDANKLTGWLSAHMVGTNWDVSIDFGGKTHHITVQVKGTGPPITVQAIDSARAHTVSVAGLPYVGTPPFQVSFDMQDRADQLIEVTDGTIARNYPTHGQAAPDLGPPGPPVCQLHQLNPPGGCTAIGNDGKPVVCLPQGQGASNQPDVCKQYYPSAADLPRCQLHQPIPPTGCSAIGHDGTPLVCLPQGQGAFNPPEVCKQYY